ncbi:hypothetical protein A3F00_04415 [Candidatus Daviesbacteria bacterium RIFCSPHIGHO2_12_FULL_37_11]|uniref:PDZ domain-containing protein n=1 Tax=Candidatus Daviesbacteria bacterium RIFCSPHIGHO2_12_FULL_37_11 TaxID=1797777 RepID=A0A1F5K9R6_9BACT|nr:MAG: hypothetical protein A2111_01995 [Candidatus Daviesbacteria bacterium GWA1_38_6]OGE16144.1 MAG: hypothetical protein A2769_03585 [Candidatus Daviesbacteria bacterium RIFCSPHIGHO2_01_FULL_37_27]OGE37667.1 MAG: hypothetical protein A3F00_04415 [Candidatus Daviesbacteria bacterium RIFCSPHIGHO2_12_FULL_37_11]OGE45422.1 MAG: hypothetical protein A3B39_04815 [Candidatus Daviesbacteria bacterium RIFCSPLOWO2_01_FULL_37_10]
MVFTVIIFIITLFILVVIHELGHFLVAKKFNIKVLEFGFGIPPRAFGKKFGETLVSLNWLPFGGFVKLLGEDETDKKALENERSFASQKVGKRIAVVVAGVAMNLILAWVLFYVVLGFQGFKVQFPLFLDHKFIGVEQKNELSILISSVTKDSPAELSGIKAGQKVVTINDEFVKSREDLVLKTRELAGRELKLTVSDPSGNEFKSVQIIPRKDPPKGQGPLGVSLAEVTIANLHYANPLEKAFAGPIHSINVVAYSGKILGMFISESIQTRKLEPISQTVSGPVGITSVVNTILTEVKNPLLPYLDFVALLSLNLAVMNVLPIPALDGGRLFFLLFEAVTRKRVHAEFEKWVHTAGMVLLLTLMLLVTFSDIKKLFP